MNGFIKIHRKITHWPLYKQKNCFHIFMHLILNASLCEKEIRGVKILPGQVKISLRHLADETGYSISQIRTALNYLAEEDITIQSLHNTNLISIVDFPTYHIPLKVTNTIFPENGKNKPNNSDYSAKDDTLLDNSKPLSDKDLKDTCAQTSHTTSHITSHKLEISQKNSKFLFNYIYIYNIINKINNILEKEKKEKKIQKKKEKKSGRPKQVDVNDVFYAEAACKAKNEIYIDFLNFLYGENDLNAPLNMIKWTKDPISELKYQTLIKLNFTPDEIKETCYAIQAKGTKYVSFFLTLRNWLKISQRSFNRVKS